MMIIYKNLRYIPGFTSTKTIAPDFVRRYVTVGDRLRRWIFHSIKTKSAGSAFVLNTKYFMLHTQNQYIRQTAFQSMEFKIDQAGEFDFDLLRETVRIAVRLQDNVIDMDPYVFPGIRKTQLEGERRIGLGTMGLGDSLIKLHIRYPRKVTFIPISSPSLVLNPAIDFFALVGNGFCPVITARVLVISST